MVITTEATTDDDFRALPPVVRRLWAWSNAAALGIVGLGLTVLNGVLGAAMGSTLTAVLAGAGTLVVVLSIAAFGFWWGGKRYDRWSWRLDEDLIEARWGVAWRHARLVPRHRVQTITTDSGPIDRSLGLRSLTVHTAGQATPNLTIPHLDADDVVWLRSELTGEAPVAAPDEAP